MAGLAVAPTSRLQNYNKEYTVTPYMDNVDPQIFFSNPWPHIRNPDLGGQLFKDPDLDPTWLFFVYCGSVNIYFGSDEITLSSALSIKLFLYFAMAEERLSYSYPSK